ncbi:MAG: immunoglobulin domain-containing protein [Oscillospiraceae bacterium]|nr:immunoglobulin domain-containing protein [Oscillospiraceae bacterium]
MKRITSLFFALLLCLTVAPTVVLPRAEAADVAVSAANFPDSVFRAYVSDNFDTNSDGKLSTAEIAAAKEIEMAVFDASAQSAYSLAGVEYLTALETLNITNNHVSRLNVSSNANLKELFCINNGLSSLDVSRNTKLTGLSCAWNYLTDLDVSANKELEWLACNNNSLCSLDVSGNTEINELYCFGNQLTSLDVSRLPNLNFLACYNNQLTSLNVGGNPELRFLKCQSNQLTALDLSKNTRLSYLLCYGNSISSLDITPCPDLVDAVRNGVKKELDDRIAYSIMPSYENESADNHCVCVDKTTVIDAGISKPTVTTQPKSKTAAPDSTVKFTVKADGEGLKYQWYYRTSSTGTWTKSTLTGAKTATLTVKATTARNGYQYKCKVSNDAGYVYSKAATLTVAAKPTITTQPSSKTAYVDTTVKFTVKASGTGLKYQWYYRTSADGTWKKSTLSSATTATLTVKAASTRSGYQYKCKVSNDAGYVYSKAATLTVSVKPVITTQPKSKTAAAGDTVKFTVKADGATSYQWYYRTSSTGEWKKYDGGTSATLSLTAKAYRDGYQYRCKVSNAKGSVYSSVATLTVK